MKKLFRFRLTKPQIDGKTAIALAVFPGIILMVLQYIFIEYNVYTWYFPQLDIPMHIVGGASVAWAVWVALSYLIQIKQLPKMPFWFAIAFVVGMTATVGIAWEFYEFIGDIMNNTQQQMWQFGPGDTMKDFADDIIGAFILSMAIGRKMLKK